MSRHSLTVSSLRHLALACAWACASVGVAHAGSVSLAQASGSIRNFKVELVDLDPNDDITPAIVYTDWINATPGLGVLGQITYQGGNIVTTQEAGVDLIGDTSSLFPSGAQDVTSTDGLVSAFASPDSMSTVLTLQQSDLSRMVLADPDYFGNRQQLIATGENRLGQFAGFPSYLTQADGSYRLASPANDPLISGEYSFTLTPNTRMVVTADLDVSALLNTTQLPQDWLDAAANPAAGDYQVAGTSVMAQALLRLSQASSSMPAPETLADTAAYFEMLRQGYQWSEAYLVASDDILHTAQNAVSSQASARLVLDNRTNTEMLGSLGVITSAGADLEGPLQVTAIPEPSTYALMGLGLVGLCLAKRRARSA
jgi:PEP-CTERM motif